MAEERAEPDRTWPVSKTTQVFKTIGADQTTEVPEGADAFKKVL